MSDPDLSAPHTGEPSRKERKRIADRNAQREHRKRQKRHVEELEAQLALVSEGGASEIASLVAENTQLRTEVGFRPFSHFSEIVPGQMLTMSLLA